MLRRFSLIFIAFVASMLFLGAAVLIGRRVETPLAVIEMVDADPDRLSYAVVDVNRSLLSRSHLKVRNVVDSRFYAGPPLILQRTRRFVFADWRLSELDLTTGQLIPRMILTTSNNARIRLSDLTERRSPEGTRYGVYVALAGEIHETNGKSPYARLVATVERNMPNVFRSPDWTRLVLPTRTGMTLTNADGGEPVITDTPPNRWPLWSPDGQYIVFAPLVFSSPNVELRVMDVETGGIAAELSGRIPVWCGDQIVYVKEDGTGLIEVHLADPATGSDQSLHVRETLPGQPGVAALPLDRGSCDWFIVNALVGGDHWLLHRETGAFIPIGINARVLDVSGGTLTYQTQIDDMTQIRQIALDPAVQDYDVLATFPRLGAEVTWLDGWRRGLLLNFRELVLIDLTHEAQVNLVALTGPVVQAFYVMR